VVPDKDFDFAASNQRFSKPALPVVPVYNKDDFFDSMTADGDKGAAGRGRGVYSNERRTNVETFGTLGGNMVRARGPCLVAQPVLKPPLPSRQCRWLSSPMLAGVALAAAARRAAADEAVRMGPVRGGQAARAAAGEADLMLPGDAAPTLDGARHPRLAQCARSLRVLRSYMA